MKCPTCSSVSPDDRICKWCGKPMSCIYAPRKPSPEETLRPRTQPKNGQGRFHKYPDKRLKGGFRMGREPYMDELLNRVLTFMRDRGFNASSFGRLVGYPSVLPALRNNKSLQNNTRERVEKAIEG